MRSKIWRVLAGVAGLAAAAIVFALLTAHPAADRAWFRADDPPVLVIAHQGGNQVRPDNTLAAFQYAAELGADVLEMDIHSTADGVLVVIHDDSVDRTTDGTGKVSEMTLDEIKALDAAYRWSPPEAPERFPYRGQGITIPTLEEVFQAFPEMRMTIEIKQADPPIGAAFCDLMRTYGMLDKVLVASFNSEAMKEFRAVCPEAATSAPQDEVLTFYVLYRLGLGQAYTPAGQAFQVPEERFGLRVLTPRFVRAAHGRNLEVQAWTINAPEDMQRMIALGVDGIITDRPDLLLELLGR